MKILAIRGKNLASLAGSFAVELDRPPLQGAGLYCISGPTGAGKSTLLDAMCAALFDQTPRLAGKSDVRLEDIGNSDVRNLLRRGASSGHAEVDFVGVDGRRYRARWCVRRARERADGAFQPQELKLQDLYSGETLGGTKSETLAVIQEKLGLSFDQFRRAVLLAQGDFAAFLKAKAGERAELLERMTGTDLYRKISRAAFERAREAGQGLADLQRQLEGIDLLPPEIRDGLDAEIARLDADVQGERLHEAEAAVAVAWHKALAGLAAAQRAAEETLEAARSAEQAAEVERREVAAVEEALPLRPLLMALDTARTAAERAAQAQRSSADETLAARGAEAGASQGRGAALHEQGRATQARADAEPSLVEASRLDGLIARAQADFEKVDGEAAEASRVAAGARAEAARCGQEVAGLQARRDRARGWLDGHADLSALGDEWGRWRAVLERATSAEARAVEVRGKRPGLERALKKALAGAEGAAVARSIAAAALDEAIRVQTEAEALAVQHPLAPLRAERQSLLIRLEALRNLKGTAKLAATAAEDETRQRAAALHAREEAANCRATAEEARRLAGLVGERLEEADRALRLARTSQDVAGYRADLRAGEHCPLCGATEHPWAAHESPLAALVQEQASRVAALQAERGEASERAAGADAQAVEREKAALACLQAAERAAALVAGEQAAWRAERMTYRRVAGGRLSHAAVGASRGSAGLYEDVPRAGMMAVGDIPPVEEAVARKADVQPDVEAFPEDVLAPEALPVVEALAGAARDHLRGIEAAEHAAEQAQQALHEAARHVQLAQGRLNTAGDALVRAEADARAAGDALQAVDREMASLSEIFDAACHELQAA
ncbi:MAG: hypothetical protein FJX76_15960, partial [Armatimonadetes bacterium]|nr:hypothetical protein [Armatimonadota bacterium]